MTMTDEADVRALKRENELYRAEAASHLRDLERLGAKGKYDRLRVAAWLIGSLAGMVLLYFLMLLWVSGSMQAAELETQKSLACIDAGGVWDRSAGSGQCVWSQPQ